MGVKRHVMSVDLPQSVSISGAEINPTARAVSTGVRFMLQFGSEQVCVEDVHFKTLS